MTRKTIWLVSIVIGIAFAFLLYLQAHYMVSMVSMSRDQFANAVNRSLDHASRAMERRETFAYLQQMVYENDEAYAYEPTGQDDEFQDNIRNTFLYQRNLLNEVVYTILYSASERPFEERVDIDLLQTEIRRALVLNDITLDFNLIVSTADGYEIYCTPGYELHDGETAFTSVLFRNDPVDKLGTMTISFPEYDSITTDAASVMLPAIIFTFVLFATFIVAVWLIFRQKQIAEMRNDFVHNMTHEFKTPLSSISLAAQMLADDSVPKSEHLLSRLSSTIVSESRRLRMQIDKVLQMSLIDRNKLNLKLNELNIHEVISSVVDTFSLKVQQNGGEIVSHLDATDCNIYADEMHFTNVIYNLLDNAVKYRRDNVPLHLEIRTYNLRPNKVCISVTDNGRGIKRDDVRRIFDRFYRVITGNQHDVKGFGLGLAYVKAIIDQHRGTIHCESEFGRGTTFTITMPSLELVNSD